LGGIRGTFFFDFGGASLSGVPFQLFTSEDTQRTVVTTTQNQVTGEIRQEPGYPIQVSGFRLVDARASYGIGLQTFLLGFPAHLDWSWRTLFNSKWEDVVFADQGGSTVFRKPHIDFWIGYDF